MDELDFSFNSYIGEEIEQAGLLPIEPTHIVGVERSIYWGDTVYFVCCLN